MSHVVCYCYSGCGTCRKALKWLETHGIEVELRPIRETPPDIATLQHALRHGVNGARRKLCNTSSASYRSSELETTLDDLSEEAFCAALNADGNLIKRPLVITSASALVGFKEAAWAEFFDVD